MKCPYCIKVCSKCGKILVANTMNFHEVKGGKYGLRGNCKICDAQYNAQYYQDHKEEKAQYRQTPQGKLVRKNAKHRRRTKTKQGKGYTSEQRQELLDFFKGCDAYTGKPMKEMSIDHIVPMNKGGVHEIWNLVPMEKTLNSSKSSKDMEKWFKKQPFYSKERLQKIYEWMEYAEKKYSTM